MKHNCSRQKNENDAHQQRLEDAPRDFTAEQGKLRNMVELADERFRAAEERALLEIDRERSAATKLQKELDAVRVATNQAAERHRSELVELQEQLGDSRQKIGVLEGHLRAVTANRDMAFNDIKSVQGQLADVTAQAPLMRIETENWRRQAVEFQRTTIVLQASSKQTPTPRKAKSGPF